MITLLSIILSILIPAIIFIITLIYINNIWLSILFAICSFIFVIAMFCIMIMLLLIIRGKKFALVYNPKDKKRWNFMNDVSSFIVFWLGVKLEIRGLEKLDANQTYVFYSNHQGFLDMFIYDLVLKQFPRGSMYKIEHMKNPLISGMVKALGGIPVNRENDRQAVKSIIAIIAEVKKGINFMIYPEGTRSRCKKINEYHPGSFKVVQKSNVPLVNIILDGSYKFSCFIPFIPTKIYVEIVDVMSPANIEDLSTVALAQKVQSEALNALEEARKNKYYRGKD